MNLRFTPRRDAHIRGWQHMVGRRRIIQPLGRCLRHLIISAGLMFPVVADPFTPPLKFIAPTVNLTAEFHSSHPRAMDARGCLRQLRQRRHLGAEARMWTQAGDLLIHRPRPADLPYFSAAEAHRAAAEVVVELNAV